VRIKNLYHEVLNAQAKIKTIYEIKTISDKVGYAGEN